MTTASSALAKPVLPAARASQKHERRIARGLVLPALVVTVVLTQVPFVVTLVFSLQNYNLLRPAEHGFAGLANYVEVVTDPDFYSSLFATVVITGGTVVLSVLLGLLLAVLLNRKFRGRWLARTLLITPFLVMPAAAALVWKWSMLDSTAGILNWAITAVGLPPVAWNTDLPVVTVVMVLTWQYTPFMMLILLAGLQSQDSQVLEAAAVDGAGRFRTFTTMTLPHLRQYVELSVLLGGVMLLQAFDPIAIMTKGAGGTKTISYLLYEKAFVGLDVGQAAAYGVIAVIITIVVASVALRLLFRIFSTQGLK